MNRKFKKLFSLLLSIIMVFSCMTAMYSQQTFASAPTVYIVGDSTGCHYADTADASYYYKRVGFGDKIADYLTGAEVENLAMSGRSSKSFTSENNYNTLLNNISSGDILIIAFGHNDEKVEDATLGTEPLGDKNTAGSFKNSLYNNYIKVAQNKGATPILCSPIVRLPKGSTWTNKDLHKTNGGDYAQCAKDLANELGIGFIDLTALTKAEYDRVGFAEAANYHAHPNETSIDNTHINNYGAKMVAYLMAQNAPSALQPYINSSAAAPNKATDLIVNPGYVAPPEGDITGDDLKSNLWTTTSPWYGSAFGVIGGNPNTTNFDISENNNTVHISASNNKGKLSSSADGLAMYYQPVSANENFQIYADVRINSIDNTSDQVGFGAIMADKILVDKRDDTFTMNYVAASPLNMAKGAIGGFAKIDNAITKGPSITTPQAGDSVRVGIIKNGTTYTTIYGNTTKTYTLTDTQMSGIMYVGLFAARNADVTFSNIIYNNEVVEGEIPTQATTETVTETISETTTINPENISSFTFWADENLNASGKFNTGSYNISGSTINVATTKGLGVKGECSGHTSYNIGKYTDHSGSLTFVPAADGWATFYMYLPSGKSMYISSTAIDKNAADVFSVSDAAIPYTMAVNAGTPYYLFADSTSDFGVAGISYTKKETATVSGTVTVKSADGNTIADGSVLTFKNNTTGEETVAQIINSSYSVELSKGFTYTCVFSGTDTLLIDSDDATASVTTTEAANSLNITLVDALPQVVTGTVYGPAGASTTIKFGKNSAINVTIGENGKGSYETNLKPGRYSVEVGTINGYTPSSLSTNELVVVNAGKENYKNVLYTKPVAAATDYDVYVDQVGTYYSNKNNVYTNLTDAMAAIDASSLNGSSSHRFVVHVAPGFYEEQFFVNSDYVSIIADSNGDSVVDGDVKISWYYGIDYMYYSIDPATGFYSKEYAVDKHTKTTCVQKWGSTMIVKGSDFYSEGITYQNTFNMELRDAELADGVENDPAGPGNNTTYDRTQPNADVKLTSATERAAALVIDGQQAEFYQCKFYSSQDTVYTGNYNHYFKECVLAGETDYIFGNGGTTVFDDCELQWIDYHYEAADDTKVKTKAGYIAVPRGSYIFRNCDITSSGLGKNVTTGNPVVTKGYYGRPWGTTAAALFMNCNTNDLILDEGWKDMSGVQPTQVAFKEYNNTKSDGSVFYSTLTETNPTAPDGSSRILTADEANALKAEYDWNIFGTWQPKSHIDYAGNPNIYKFDFTTGNVTSPVSDKSGTAQLTHSGIKYHGSTYGATLSNGSTMTVYAGSDAASMEIAVNSSYNGNAGTLELYKNDETTPVDSIEFNNEVDNEVKTFTVTNVNAGDSFTVKYIGSATFYCGNVTVSSDDGTLTTAPVTNTYEFDFTAAAAGHTQGEIATGSILDKNEEAAITLGNNVKYHSTSYGFMLSDGAEINFTVNTPGKTTINILSSYQDNIGSATILKDGKEIASTDTLTGIVDGTIKANLESGTYTIRYSTTGSFYTKGITIITSGNLAVPEESYEIELSNSTEQDIDELNTSAPDNTLDIDVETAINDNINVDSNIDLTNTDENISDDTTFISNDEIENIDLDDIILNDEIEDIDSDDVILNNEIDNVDSALSLNNIA